MVFFWFVRFAVILLTLYTFVWVQLDPIGLSLSSCFTRQTCKITASPFFHVLGLFPHFQNKTSFWLSVRSQFWPTSCSTNSWWYYILVNFSYPFNVYIIYIHIFYRNTGLFSANSQQSTRSSCQLSRCSTVCGGQLALQHHHRCLDIFGQASGSDSICAGYGAKGGCRTYCSDSGFQRL